VCLLRGTFCPHSVFMCFVWIWEQTAISSLFSINWLVFITETECLLRGTFCPHSVFMCFVWNWEQTEIISLYSINWLVFITKTECVYCAVRSAHTVYVCVLCGSDNKQRLFHCAALTDWFLWPRRSLFTVRYVLPTQCIYVFCVDLTTNNDYFTVQH
jgi:hypothetical protein